MNTVTDTLERQVAERTVTLAQVNRELQDEIAERKNVQEALNRRLVALTEPLETAEVSFSDLFDIEEIQGIQDAFAEATRVASIITYPDGTPITRPSNFCRLCNDLIRKTKKGLENCFYSDAIIGRQNPTGPIIQLCLSGGLWDAGASITVGGEHIANWLIGQVKNEAIDEEKIIRYAGEIGADEDEFRQALQEVPVMSNEQFQKVANALFLLANELSLKAYQNVQQARFITQRQQAEEALRLSEEKYRALVENINDVIFSLDAQGSFTYISPAIERFAGYEVDQVMGQPFARFVHPADLATLQTSFTQTLTGNLEPSEFRIIAQDGAVLPVRTFSRPLWEDGQLVGLTGIMTDITERVRAEEELKKHREHLEDLVQERTAALEDANAELSQYAYVASHDLRAPLRAIHNYADFLREDLQGTLDGDQKIYLDGLGRAVREAGDMVEDLLKLSRLDRYDIRPETIDLGTFLRDLIASLHLPAEVEVVMGADWPTLDAEPALLRQIFQNLVDNAVKFNASPHKQVELGWRPAGKEAYAVFVRDNGIGIDPRYHEQIFRLFEQLHTREEYEGTGVGLAIVKKAAGRLRGSVRVESEIGQGSTFFVTLPKAQKERGT